MPDFMIAYCGRAEVPDDFWLRGPGHEKIPT